MYETNTNLFQFSDQMSSLPWWRGKGVSSARLNEIKLSLCHLQHVACSSDEHVTLCLDMKLFVTRAIPFYRIRSLHSPDFHLGGF